MNDTHTPGLGSIAAAILDQQPEPQENAIVTAQEHATAEENPPLQLDAPAPAPAVMGALDANGEAWNPDIHATGADGAGVKTAKGLWRKRRGVAPSRIGNAARPTAAPADDTQSRAAGVACAHTVFMFGRMIGGEEWAPRVNQEINEIALMEKAWGDYFVSKGYTDFPPGMALSMALAGYALPRFTMPVTQSRLTKFKQWAAAKWIGWKARKEQRAGSTANIDVSK